MSFLAALASHHDRLIGRGQASPPGLGPARLGYALVLDPSGQLVSVDCLLESQRGLLRPPLRLAPKAPQRGHGVVSGLLWDKSSYVLGVWDATEGAQPRKTADRIAQEHAAFVDLHLAALSASLDPGLQALRLFVQSWSPQAFADLDLLQPVAGHNLCFRLAGETSFIHDSPAAHELARTHALTSDDLGVMQCSLTGALGPICRIHPRISGAPGANTTGASLVTHSAPAFQSFGAVQGANAPILVDRAYAYGEALDILLARRGDEEDGGAPLNRVSIGGDTLVFWGESEAAEQAIRNGLGIAARSAGPDTAGLNLQQMVGFALLRPNGGRLGLRRFLHMTLGCFLQRIEGFLKACSFEAYEPEHLDLRRLCQCLSSYSTGRPPHGAWAGMLCLAILEGRRPPIGLLAHLMMLIAGDGGVSAIRAGVMKACLSPDQEALALADGAGEWARLSGSLPMELGRIFACLAAYQAWEEGAFAARGDHDLLSAASACPAHILPLRIARVHQVARSRTARGGRVDRIVGQLNQIVDRIGGLKALPLTLALSERAMFMIGFHRQRHLLNMPIQPQATGSDIESEIL